ncbi:hypothetical protein [Borrelia sp. P9F1]|uniref:hypothetical protein n=1 Tax=Borrelia sp. P9F1 TaxID=3058374 RepID=UPI002649A677|nr:hypothetical protein [Borrelia sp. P9F1]WKC58479.1 hypothetical protein QYZ68_04485 [Borrelia sp. P9F1]
MSHAQNTRTSEEKLRDRVIEHARLQIKDLIKEQVSGNMSSGLDRDMIFEMAGMYNVDGSLLRRVPLQDMYAILKVYPLLQNKEDYHNNINYYINAWMGVKRMASDELEQFRKEELYRVKEEEREKKRQAAILEAMKAEVAQNRQQAGHVDHSRFKEQDRAERQGFITVPWDKYINKITPYRRYTNP